MRGRGRAKSRGRPAAARRSSPPSYSRVERLNGEVVRIVRSPEVAQRLRGEAFELPADTPDQFAAVIRAELAKWAPIVKEAGLKPE